MNAFQKDFPSISRRDFLKISGATLLSLLIIPNSSSHLSNNLSRASFAQEEEENLGRVCAIGVGLYEQPSFQSRYLSTLRKDAVFPITKIVTGDSVPAHNRVWYELDGQGYAHSGMIQPVSNRLNTPLTTLPANRVLVEVTVPFTAAHWSADSQSGIPYYLYYGSTYWVDRVKEGPGGVLWYRIRDEEDYTFYAEGSHLRILSEEDLSPIQPNLPLEDKRIEVHIQEQVVIAYEQEQPVFMTRVSTGAQFQTGNYQTPLGQFQTNRKRPNRHMIDPNGGSYDLPGVPWVTYLTERGVAFHGTYWHNDFGKPRSHGCINLSNEAARWLYRWTYPTVPLSETYLAEMTGTRVDVI